MDEDKFFVGQTNLRIELDTEVDCSGATVLIKFIKPSGAEGNFSASIDGVDPTLIYYDIQDTDDLDIPGDWRFWAHVTFSDTTVGIGKVRDQEVLAEGALEDESDSCNL